MRRILIGAGCIALIGLVGFFTYNWFRPSSPVGVALAGQCDDYRAAMERTEAGLDSETAADPREIQLVLDQCEKIGQ